MKLKRPLLFSVCHKNSHELRYFSHNDAPHLEEKKNCKNILIENHNIYFAVHVPVPKPFPVKVPVPHPVRVPVKGICSLIA